MIYNYGDELKPASDPVVRYEGTQLVFDKDISVTYTNNVNVGTAKATFYGLGNYCGSFVTEYKITPKISVRQRLSESRHLRFIRVII